MVKCTVSETASQGPLSVEVSIKSANPTNRSLAPGRYSPLRFWLSVNPPKELVDHTPVVVEPDTDPFKGTEVCVAQITMSLPALTTAGSMKWSSMVSVTVPQAPEEVADSVMVALPASRSAWEGTYVVDNPVLFGSNVPPEVPLQSTSSELNTCALNDTSGEVVQASHTSSTSMTGKASNTTFSESVPAGQFPLDSAERYRVTSPLATSSAEGR